MPKRPDHPPTKDQVKEWFNNATPGEQKAVDQAANYIADWQTSAGTAWFGASINPSTIWAKCEEAAKKYGVDDAHVWVLYYNPAKRAEIK